MRYQKDDFCYACMECRSFLKLDRASFNIGKVALHRA